MDPTTFENWCKLIDKYGVSVVMLVVFVVGTVIAVRWLANNVAKPIVFSHFNLAESLRVKNEENARNIASLNTSHAELAESQAKILKAIENSGENVCGALGHQTHELKLALACRFKEA